MHTMHVHVPCSWNKFFFGGRGREALDYNEPLTISPVAAQCNGACGKRSSIECVHIDRCWPQKSWRWRLRSTLNLGSDRFRCFNHRDELDSTVFLPNFRLVALLQSRAGQPLVTLMRAIYSARLALFIHGIT